MSRLQVINESRNGSLVSCSIKMVGARGVEPRTSSLSETRSNQLSYAPEKNIKPKPEGMLQNFGLMLLNVNGAGDGTRTHNSLLGRQGL